MFSPEDFIIRRQCTPFCEEKCKYAGQHHKILVSIINCVDNRGYSKFTRTIAKFVKKGWNLNNPIEDPDPEFRYPLIHWATVLGNVMVLRWCVNEPSLYLNKRWGQRSETALHRLMVCGYSALRESSVDILKTFKKLVKLLKVLLPSKDDNKDLPIHVAAKVLVERPLVDDSRFDRTYTEMLKILLKVTCDVDAELLDYRNIEGNTVMHIVAQHDKGAEIVEMLVENGADCELSNLEGFKPIDIARAREATDVIGLLSRSNEESSENDDKCGLEEIGDMDVIYIESDDDTDNNNSDGNDEAYIRNLLQRVKSERDDGNDVYDVDNANDPDWNVIDIDASTSNETLFSTDEESFDIDVPGISLNQARPTALNSKNSSVNSEKPKCDLKRKLADNESLRKSEVKKSKVLRKESEGVLPILEIQLNKSKFKSLKRKIRQEATGAQKAAKGLFGASSSPERTPTPNKEIPQSHVTLKDEFVEETLETSQSFAQRFNSAADTTEVLETVEEHSDQENKCELFSSKVTNTLSRLFSDEMKETQDQLNYLPVSHVKERSPAAEPAKNRHSSPDLTTEKPTDEISRSKTPEEVAQSPEDSPGSFSSSEEIRSAWQSVNGPKSNLSPQREAVDISKPVKTRTEQPIGTLSSALTTEQDLSTPTEQLLTMEEQRSSPSPGLIEQHKSTPSPPSTEQPRGLSFTRKRIEDVITSLRERQQTGITSRRGSCESISSTENNPTPTVRMQQSDSTIGMEASTCSLIKEAKSNLTSDEESESNIENQNGALFETDKQERTLSSNNDEPKDEKVSPLPEQNRSSVNIAIKKEVDDTQYSGKCFNDRAESGQKQPDVCSSAASQENNQITASSLSDDVRAKQGAKEQQRISRNALPTQIQAGSYRAMIPGGASTSTTVTEKPSGEDASTGTQAHISSNGGEDYQPLQSLTPEVESMIREVINDRPPVCTSDNNVAQDYDPVYSVIDKVCEELYGISSGPQRTNEKQNETTKQAESSPQGNVAQKPEPKVDEVIKIKQEPEADENENQTVTHDQILGTPTRENESGSCAASPVQTDTMQGQAVPTPIPAFQPVIPPPQRNIQNQTQSFAPQQQLPTNVRPGQAHLFLVLQSQTPGLAQASQLGVQQQGLRLVQRTQHLQTQPPAQHLQNPLLVQHLQTPRGQVRPEHVLQRPMEGQRARSTQINSRTLTPEQSQYLTHIQQRYRIARQGSVKKISWNNARRQVNSQNFGVTQQNIIRPANVRRPEILIENRGTHPVPVLRPVSQTIIAPATYVPRNTTTMQVPSRQLLVQPRNPPARQLTLEQYKQYYQARANSPTYISAQQIQPSIVVQRFAANQANFSEGQIHHVSNLSHGNVQRSQTGPQIQASNAPHVLQGAVVTTPTVVGPDIVTAMANQINQDPTNRSAVTASVPAIVISSEPTMSSVSTSQVSGNGVSNSTSEKPLCTMGK